MCLFAVVLELSSPELQRVMAAPNFIARRHQSVSLDAAVNRLPALYREVFVLRTFKDPAIKPIANGMSRSAAAARVLWAHAVHVGDRLMEGQA